VQVDRQYHPGSFCECQTGVMPDPHGDLGALLRAWRDRLSPADVGLRVGDTMAVSDSPSTSCRPVQ